MSTELQIAILGVIGTLLGTVLGWLLNSLSQKGKIKVFIKKWKETFQKPDHMGGFKDCDRTEAEYYYYSLSIDAYNSSRETRIMRDVRILFGDKKKTLFSKVPRDDAKKRTSNTLVHYDEISLVNIPPKSGITISLHGSLDSGDKEWSSFADVRRIVLEYADEKNKRKSVDICRRGD